MVHSEIHIMLSAILSLLRIVTASYLIGVSFYLQVVAEETYDNGGEPIPLTTRVAPAFLGILLLHRSGAVTLFPFSYHVTGLAMYSTILLFLYIWFRSILARYDLRPPRKQIPIFIRESIPWVPRDDSYEEHDAAVDKAAEESREAKAREDETDQ